MNDLFFFIYLQKELKKLNRRLNTMATQEEIQQLQDGIAALGTKLGEIKTAQVDFATDFKAAVDELKKQIEAGATSGDLAPALAALAALSTDADDISASLKTVDTDAETISGKPTA